LLKISEQIKNNPASAEEQSFKFSVSTAKGQGVVWAESMHLIAILFQILAKNNAFLALYFD